MEQRNAYTHSTLQAWLGLEKSKSSGAVAGAKLSSIQGRLTVMACCFNLAACSALVKPVKKKKWPGRRSCQEEEEEEEEVVRKLSRKLPQQ
jgi:hypothetical protein